MQYLIIVQILISDITNELHEYTNNKKSLWWICYNLMGKFIM